MDTALLDYKDLTLANTQAGQWSTGVLEPANQGSFTLLPTSMVLATDITVSASAFSSHTKDVFEQYSASTGAFVSTIITCNIFSQVLSCLSLLIMQKF